MIVPIQFEVEINEIAWEDYARSSGAPRGFDVADDVQKFAENHVTEALTQMGLLA